MHSEGNDRETAGFPNPVPKKSKMKRSVNQITLIKILFDVMVVTCSINRANEPSVQHYFFDVPPYCSAFILLKTDSVPLFLSFILLLVPELVLLEVREQVSPGLDRLHLGHVVREAAVDPRGWKEEGERKGRNN